MTAGRGPAARWPWRRRSPGRRRRSAGRHRRRRWLRCTAPGHRLALWTLWLLLIAVPFVLDSAQKDAFRLPKALLGETLALLSLFFLALAWKGPEEWRRLLRAPFVAMFGPFVVLATLLSLASPHLAHVHRGLVGLWIGALAVWGWSVGFSRRELGEALHLLPRPGVDPRGGRDPAVPRHLPAVQLRRHRGVVALRDRLAGRQRRRSRGRPRAAGAPGAGGARPRPAGRRSPAWRWRSVSTV